MSDTSNTNPSEKAAKIRRKPERESILSPTFAAVRQSGSDGLLQRHPSGRGLLQRRCSCGKHTLAGGKCEACRQNQEVFFLQRAAVPVIQRAANFVSGPVSEEINVAEHLMQGAPAGTTSPELNGMTFKTMKDPLAALNKPLVKSEAKEDGTAEAWVEEVPTNQASFIMTLPSNDAWITGTTNSEIVELFTKLKAPEEVFPPCKGPSQATILSVNGQPSDTEFAENVQTHEDLHVSAIETGFNNVIGSWDRWLQQAKDTNRRFEGVSEDDAKGQLFAAAGGTPERIAKTQIQEWVNLNEDVHQAGTSSATGGPIKPSNPGTNKDCTSASVDAT